MNILKITALFQLPLLLLSLTSCKNLTISEGKSITTSKAMVVSAHPDASRVGARILSEGGNAIDAAVAVEFALAVCYPSAGNIGGGGFMIIRMNDGIIDGLDYREKAPENAYRDMYLDDRGEVIKKLSTDTQLASGVPGTVDGMVKAHARYGELSWEEVLQPAVDLAENGFIVAEKQASSLNSMKKTFIERNDGIVRFVRDDTWKEGDTLIQPELAKTLKLIRDNGREGFYSGEIADLIVSEMKRGNGIITHQDLNNYQSVWRSPLTGTYRNEYRVISMAPPSSGGVALLQLLGITESLDMEESGFLTSGTIHFMAEAERRVYADRAKYLGDPDYYPVPVEALLDKEYLKGRMENFNPHKAVLSSDLSHGLILMPESEETTHFSVVDTYGNAVAVTTTLNASYGNAVVVQGAGFLLNNEMDDFSMKAGVPNMFGLVGGVANEIAPGKRMLSSMTPTIVEKNGELFMVVGSPGGSTIITSVYQTILNVIDHGMTIGDAVTAGRFHHQWLPDQISYETGAVDSAVIEMLIAKGHILKDRTAIGRVDAIVILPDGRLTGGADPRGDDLAAGF